MKIAICGSIAFFGLMQLGEIELSKLGYDVEMPPAETEDEAGNSVPIIKYYEQRKAAADTDTWIWERKAEAMRLHFENIASSDAILVLNCDKNGVEGYIGSNTLLEMGLAFYLRKPIYLWNIIPHQSCREEILAMRPVLINGDYVAIKP